MKNCIKLIVLLLANFSMAQSDGIAKVHIEMKTKRSDNFKLFSTMYDENEAKNLTKINEEVFETNIKVTKPDVYLFQNAKKGEANYYENTIYLEPGFDLKVFVDENNIENPYIITGKGAVENQMLIKKNLVWEVIKQSELKNLLDLNKTEEDAKTVFISKYDVLLKSAEFKSCSANFKIVLQKDIKWFIDDFVNEYAAQLKLKKDQKNKIKVAFEYANLNKQKISLASFKGKYVYIDLWATTCGPCILQFPYLEKLKEKYKGKNIEFVSISLDRDIKRWGNYVTKHKLGGVHLYCSNEKDDFMTSINLNGIPRMLIIDPEGNIIDFSAKLPSDPELINDINKLFVKN